VSIEGGVALLPTKGNVTTGEPKCRTGNSGGVPGCIQGAVGGNSLPHFFGVK